MNIFSKKKLKVRNESTKEHTKFCIEYYNLEDFSNFKTKLLKEMLILSNTMSLVIVDSNLSFDKTQIDKEESIDKLTNLLDSLHIKYRKKIVKPTENVSSFGAIIKLGKNKNKKDYIVGFAISKKGFENLESILNCYNIHYYIDPLGLDTEALIEEVETYYFDEDELNNKFNYSVFDCTSIKNMAISLKTENEQFINNIINSIKKDFE